MESRPFWTRDHCCPNRLFVRLNAASARGTLITQPKHIGAGVTLTPHHRTHLASGWIPIVTAYRASGYPIGTNDSSV